jgi:hypothetical protein
MTLVQEQAQELALIIHQEHGKVSIFIKII